MAIILAQGKQQFFDSNGDPLVGGLLYTWAPGAGITTPKATHQDAAGTILNTNPIVLNARGEALVFWTGGYNVKLTDSAANLIYTVENINIDASAATLDAALRADLANTADAAKGAGMIGLNPALAYAAGTPGWWDKHIGVSVFRYIPSSLWAGIVAGTNVTNLSTYVQAALDDALTVGFILLGHGYTYKTDTPPTLVRGSAGQAKYCGVRNFIFNLAAMGTSGAGFTVGSTRVVNSFPYFLEDGGILLDSIILRGPENSALDPEVDPPGTSTIGFDFVGAGNLTHINCAAFGFYKAAHSLSSYPLMGISFNGRRSWVTVHLDEASNLQTWEGIHAPESRYGILIKADSTSIDAGKINNVTLNCPWTEGAAVGIVIDTGTGGIGATPFRSIHIKNPYFARMGYDFVRIGTVWTLATPAVRGSNCSEFVDEVTISGGLYNPNLGLFSATQALVAFDTVGRCGVFKLDAMVEGPRLNAFTFANAPTAGYAITSGYPGTSDRITEQIWWNAAAVVRRLFQNGTVMIGPKSTAATVAQLGIELRPDGLIYHTATGNVLRDANRTEAGGGTVDTFRAAGVAVGSISVNATNTAYNTSSDYRLKSDIKTADGAEALATVMAWTIRSFTWNVDKSPGIGVLAHELQEVLPHAVHGSKDANEMQGVDYSKMMPHMVAALQYMELRLEALEAAQP